MVSQKTLSKFVPGLEIEAASQCQSRSDPLGKSGLFRFYRSDFKQLSFS